LIVADASPLIVIAKSGLLSAVAPILDQWQRSGYFLSMSVAKAVLDKAGEA
jgi:predicted nucleic acid-binding protein